MANKVFIKNFGCSSNTADGEVLAGCLAEAGFQITPSESEADVLIYNSCAVKGPTENRIIDAIKHAPKTKKIIVAGCLPMISLERLTREKLGYAKPDETVVRFEPAATNAPGR